jgi:hypothetical protein
MMCDIEDRGEDDEDERGDGGVDGRTSSADCDVLRLGGNTTLPSCGDLRLREAAGSAQRPELVAAWFRQCLSMSSSTPGHFLTPASRVRIR